MRLISLELHGFKSFADRTKINFDKGMTVIVGPNGSGKSNISDAIKWVLGEISAKNLRGVKLEDIIFGGTEKRSPMTFAEVSITIDNTGESRIDSEYDVITVTRRYFKNGDSEYFINSRAVRLKDIVDLFMNTGIGKTGYSIVGQGRIGEIISQKSEERRYIFEEAAGISKYRIRKNESEKKLVEINSNLDRVTDIASLLEARVGPLAEEAEKARIYLEIYEKKKACDVALILYDIDTLAKQNEDFERSYAIAEHNLEIADNALESINRRSDIIMTESEEKKNKIEELRNLLSEITENKHTLESSLLVSNNNISYIEKEKQRYEKEIKELEGELSLTDEEGKKLLSKKNECEKEVALRKAELEEAEESLNNSQIALKGLETEYNQAIADKSACEKLHIEKRIRLSALESTQQSLVERLSSLSDDMRSAQDSLLKTNEKITASRTKLEDYKTRSDKINSDRNAISEECDYIEKRKEEIADEINNIRGQKAAKLRQIDALKRMEEHFEGYQKSVKFVLDAAASGSLSGICGPVSRLINVEPQYVTAIEASLGGNIQNIIVENEEAAKKAIALLKSANAGRTTFYPITSVHPDRNRQDNARMNSERGFIGVASDLVKYENKYSDVVAYLLGKTYVFDNIDNAEYAAKRASYSIRAVTLDGQLINVGGSFTGGSARRDSGMFTRSNEISALALEAENLEKDEKDLLDEISEIEKESREKKASLSELNQTYLILASLYKAEETSLSMLESQLEAQEHEISVMEDSSEHVQNQEDAGIKLKLSIEEEIAKLEKSTSELSIRIEFLSNEITKAQEDLRSSSDEKNIRMMDVLSASKEAEVANDAYDRYEYSRNSIEERVKSAKNNINDSINRRNEIENEIKSLNEKLCNAEQDTQSAQNEIETLNENLKELSAEDSSLRIKLREKSAERDLFFQEFTKLEIKKSALSGEREKLTGRLFDEYELTYSAAKELNYPPVEEKTRGHFVYELGRYRSKIRELGNVNVGAIEEYASVKSEFDFLSKQIEDLNASKNKYMNILANIEKEMCTRFSETFNEINNHFKTVFRDLFGGGSASLSLTDPTNVLTSGIEIEVAPPGKVIKNLKALSGGEQVFVAIAILFAIFKVNPPPFCLLDEIESALDEVNVVRFAQYANKFCDKTQFIVISHRRGTMESANSLYGVTMQERGITSLLSVNVNEVESKIGIKE